MARKPHLTLLAALSCVLASPGLSVAKPLPATAGAGQGGLVLDESGYWRVYCRFDWDRICPECLAKDGQKLLGDRLMDRKRREGLAGLKAAGIPAPATEPAGMPAKWMDYLVCPVKPACTEWAEGQPYTAPPPRRLVPAGKSAKMECDKYLNGIQPVGQTDPIPALKRGFEVLAQAPGKGDKIIFLLTDGDFPDNDEVFKTIKSHNTAGSVRVYTVLHQFKVESAMDVLKKIAGDNGGSFKFVETID